MAKFSTGSSRAIVDLRKRKPGAHTRPFSFREPPRRSSSSPERLRPRRRRFRVIGALAAVVVLLAAAYGVSWASYRPAYSIQDIRVSGTSEVPKELVRSYVETKLHDGRYSFLSRSNIFFYPRDSIERAVVERFPRRYIFNHLGNRTAVSTGKLCRSACAIGAFGASRISRTRDNRQRQQ